MESNLKMHSSEWIRSQFPALNQKIRGKDFIYLDSAATSLKPISVIDRINKYYSFETANVHRGAHYLSDLGTQNFESARASIQKFINAQNPEEIIFTKGTTESINMIASTWGEVNISEGDVILVTEMEHHANIVPWQMLATRKKAQVIPVKTIDNGELCLADLAEKLNLKNVKILSFTACSNVLGTMNPVASIVSQAHAKGIKVLVDGAQYVAQAPTDVSTWNCDFFVFSSHKLFGPQGFGVLYGKKEILENLPPYQGGGSMISEVKFSGTTFNQIPFRFEAGTPHIEGAIGTHAAIDFVNQVGIDFIHQRDQELLKFATDQLMTIPNLKIYGESPNKGSVISFNIEKIHASDLGQLLDQQGIAIRVGHHCAQPLMQKYGVSGMARVSFSIFNTEEEIEKLIKSIMKARDMLL